MRPVRLELTAPRLKGGCSTTELRARKTAKELREFCAAGTLTPKYYTKIGTEKKTFLLLRQLRCYYYTNFYPVCVNRFTKTSVSPTVKNFLRAANILLKYVYAVCILLLYISFSFLGRNAGW